jgi:hypothetical protein
VLVRLPSPPGIVRGAVPVICGVNDFCGRSRLDLAGATALVRPLVGGGPVQHIGGRLCAAWCSETMIWGEVAGYPVTAFVSRDLVRARLGHGPAGATLVLHKKDFGLYADGTLVTVIAEQPQPPDS